MSATKATGKNRGLPCHNNLLLVDLVRNKLKVNHSTYKILQIISLSTIKKVSINELLTNQNCKNTKKLYCNHLKINWI